MLPKKKTAPKTKAKEVKAGEPAVIGRAGVAVGASGGVGLQVGPNVGRGVAVAS